jgi:hypothetical protein
MTISPRNDPPTTFVELASGGDGTLTETSGFDDDAVTCCVA